MSVIVCQRGARHRYAIPRMLEDRGLLSALYTDSHATSPLGRILSPFSRYSTTAARLAGRKPDGIPVEKLYSTDRAALQNFFGKKIDFSNDFIRWGVRDARCVYSMVYGSGWRFLKEAKTQGLKIIMDVFIHPAVESIVRNEMKRHPWSAGPASTFLGHPTWLLTLFGLADVLLCPCKSVAEGVVELNPDFRDKVRVLPYGSSFDTNIEPIERRPNSVLFAGSDFLRKGLHYLAEAAVIVREAIPEASFRVAGLSAKQVPDAMPHKGELTFLGRLPMHRMREEYGMAEVFALPSLAEGQAGVVLEALAFGTPVVATPEAGVDFENGVNGLHVQARDARALANAIISLLKDPSARVRIGSTGKKWASQQFSITEWGERLSRLIVGIL